jgi:hypothetical protein
LSAAVGFDEGLRPLNQSRTFAPIAADVLKDERRCSEVAGAVAILTADG